MREFVCPTKIYSGTGSLDALTQYPAKRALLVTDPYFSTNGTVELLRSLMPDTVVQVFDHVTPDPSVTSVAEGAAVCRRVQPDMLIALGGGSAMDCAKGIRFTADYPMVFVAIPTTSGSGSEVTSYTVLSKDGQKIPLMDAGLRPNAAILDDRFLQTLPKSLVANAGMDILAHALEALTATGRSGFTDALAMHAAQCVLEKLEESYQGNLEVRMELHEAAAMAGLAFEQAGLGVCHSLAHAMGGAFSLPHGTLCGMLLPAVLAMNAETSIRQYARLAKQCGMPAATDRLALRNLLSYMEKLRRKLQMPDNLRQAGVEPTQWQEKKESILTTALQDPCCKTNPVVPTRERLETIYGTVAP